MVQIGVILYPFFIINCSYDVIPLPETRGEVMGFELLCDLVAMQSPVMMKNSAILDCLESELLSLLFWSLLLMYIEDIKP